jgi:hypothetical protein
MEEQIAHASANQVGFVASLPQGADNRDGKLFEHSFMQLKQEAISALFSWDRP